MSRNNDAERREHEERRRRGCDNADPWFGHTATDVTYALHPPVPKHSGHPRLMHAPDPCYNRTATDITMKFHSRPNSLEEYYYGKQETDVTAHLVTPVPKFVDPHGCASECYTVKRKSREELQTPKEAHSHNQRAYDYMHPLGAHRPFPLSDYYFHGGSKPSTPCRSRSGSPTVRPQTLSPSPDLDSKVPRSRSPRPALDSKVPRSRSRSPSPDPAIDWSVPKLRSRSPGPSKGEARDRSRSPSPQTHASYDQLSPHHNIPLKYLECRNGCQLCPPCEECARLLDEDRRCRGP